MRASPSLQKYLDDLDEQWAYERGMRKRIEKGIEQGVQKGIEKGVEQSRAEMQAGRPRSKPGCRCRSRRRSCAPDCRGGSGRTIAGTASRSCACSTAATCTGCRGFSGTSTVITTERCYLKFKPVGFDLDYGRVAFRMPSTDNVVQLRAS